MSKEKAIELIKDSLLEIPDIDADRGCGAYIHIVSETIVAVCNGKFFPCVFKDSEDFLATDWEEV